jgi:hypothetical protein
MPHLILLLNVLHSQSLSLFKTFLDLVIDLVIIVFTCANLLL